MKRPSLVTVVVASLWDIHTDHYEGSLPPRQQQGGILLEFSTGLPTDFVEFREHSNHHT